MASGVLNVKVDLSKFNLKKQTRDMAKGLQNGIKQGALLAERSMKKKSPVSPGGGRHRSSISITLEKFKATIGARVVYAGWVNDGRDSPNAPKKLRGSSFKGHKIVQRTITEISGRVGLIINNSIGRKI